MPDIQLPERGFSNFTALGEFCKKVVEEHAAGTAERKHDECAVDAQALLRIGEQARADYDTVVAVNGKRSEELIKLRAEHEAATEPDFIEALSDASKGIAHFSKGSADRAQAISFLIGVTQYARERAMPKRLLSMLEAEWQMIRAATTLLAWQCVIAGVKRYHAAQSLVETDGAATFAPIGRTYELFEQYVACSRREYRAYEGWQAEKTRQKDREALR